MKSITGMVTFDLERSIMIFTPGEIDGKELTGKPVMILLELPTDHVAAIQEGLKFKTLLDTPAQGTMQ